MIRLADFISLKLLTELLTEMADEITNEEIDQTESELVKSACAKYQNQVKGLLSRSLDKAKSISYEGKVTGSEAQELIDQFKIDLFASEAICSSELYRDGCEISSGWKAIPKEEVILARFLQASRLMEPLRNKVEWECVWDFSRNLINAASTTTNQHMYYGILAELHKLTFVVLERLK